MDGLIKVWIPIFRVSINLYQSPIRIDKNKILYQSYVFIELLGLGYGYLLLAINNRCGFYQVNTLMLFPHRIK